MQKRCNTFLGEKSINVRGVVFLLLMMAFAVSVGQISSNQALSYSPMALTDSATPVETEDENFANDINDINVSMDSSGKISIEGIDNGDSTKSWNLIFQKYKVIIIGVAGVLTLTFIGFFLMNFGKIGASGTNTSKRTEAIIGCVWTAVAAALSGSVTLVTALFWNALK